MEEQVQENVNKIGLEGGEAANRTTERESESDR